MNLPSQPPLIVLGMHRSGTSLVSRLLDTLGVHMGAELDMHHEAWCFKNVNRELLHLGGGFWTAPEPFVEALVDPGFVQRCCEHARRALAEQWPRYGDVAPAASWGWKDPRNTITLPVWLRLFPEAKVLHVERNGLDVALSLHRRELRQWTRRTEERRLSPPTIGAAYRLRDVYLEQARRHQQQHPDLLTLQYETLLAEPLVALQRVVAWAGIEADEAALVRAAALVGRPTRRSWLEVLRIRAMLRLGILDPRVRADLHQRP